MRQGGVLSYVVGDHLGSTSLTLNASGNKIGELKYYPYGETRYSWGSVPTDRRFTGQRQEDAAALGSLYDYGACAYSPLVGRFLSADTVVPDPKDPQHLNRFSYTANNPLKYVDPTGHMLTECAEGCATDEDWATNLLKVVGQTIGAADPTNAARLQIARFWFRETLKGWTPEAGPMTLDDAARDAWAGTAALIRGGTPEATLAGMKIYGTLLTDIFIGQVQAMTMGRNVGPMGVPSRTGWAEEVYSSGSGLADCSFSADTPVMTDKGEQAIATLKIGDHVYAYNTTLGTNGYYTVTAVLAHVDPIIEYLMIDGEQIETTPEHPFYTMGFGWLPAGELWTGIHVRKADGEYGTVWAINLVRRDQRMYNLTVADAHTFFVGAQQWLVHNQCPPKVYRVADYIEENGGTPPPGYRGGSVFQNDGRGGGQVLRSLDVDGNSITYYEYDVNPYTPGVNRGAERIVIGSDGSRYYTNDHYQTFTPF